MLSLKIKGNKHGNEGIGPDLLAIGDDRFPVLDSQYPQTGSITDFIVVRHLPNKSVYTFVTKNVTPCDSNRPGTLLISVAIPSGERVDSLFNLLIELSSCYKQQYMAYDGTNYHFLDAPENPEPFEEIISRHPIEKYPYRTIVTSDDLNSVAYIFMTPAQIAALLDDPMRPEFAKFGQIVLAPMANPASMASTINVPTRIWRNYKVVVNGQQSSQIVSDPKKPVAITIPETDSTEAASLTFTIEQVRDGQIKGAMADDIAQVINITLVPEKKAITAVIAEEDNDAPATMSMPLGGSPSAKPRKGSKAQAAKKKNNVLMLVCSFATFLIIAGVAGYFLFSSKEEARPATEQLYNDPMGSGAAATPGVVEREKDRPAPAPKESRPRAESRSNTSNNDAPTSANPQSTGSAASSTLVEGINNAHNSKPESQLGSRSTLSEPSIPESAPKPKPTPTSPADPTGQHGSGPQTELLH